MNAIDEMNRNELFDLMEEETRQIREDPKELMKYLKVQSRFDYYSPANLILITAQNPSARKLHSEEEWEESDYSVLPDQSPLYLWKPVPDTGPETKQQASFSPVPYFDIQQTNAAGILHHGIFHLNLKWFATLLRNQSRIPIRQGTEEGDYPPYFDNSRKCIIEPEAVRSDHAYLVEFCLSVIEGMIYSSDPAFSDEVREEARLIACSLAWTFGMDGEAYGPIAIPEVWQELNGKELRERLALLHEIQKKLKDQCWDGIRHPNSSHS